MRLLQSSAAASVLMATPFFAAALASRTVTAFAPRQVVQQQPPFARQSQTTSCSDSVRLSMLLSESASTNLQSTLAQVDAFWQAFPYTAAAIVCGVKASAADLIAQSSESPNGQSQRLSSAASDSKDSTEPVNSNLKHGLRAQFDNDVKSKPTSTLPSDTDTDTGILDDLLPSWISNCDPKRNFAFLLYGSLYQGMAHEYIFNHLYPIWFGTGTDLGIVLLKVAFNLLIQTTLVTLPVAYIAKAVVCQDTWSSALDKYIYDIREQGLLTKAFLLWGPTHCLTFSVIPEHWRVTFIAVVSFFWLIALSSISANESTAEFNPETDSVVSSQSGRKPRQERRERKRAHNRKPQSSWDNRREPRTT